jgi:hypothetical protein
MKLIARIVIVLLVTVMAPAAQANPPAELCRALRAFVESVRPDETREITFRTSWGTNFKDATEPAMRAKRCEHGEYEPAKQVCAYLIEHGPTEFSDITVKDSISCLSRKTKFDGQLNINSGEFSFSYGSENRGALIEIYFAEDKVVGGDAFRLVADGY